MSTVATVVAVVFTVVGLGVIAYAVHERRWLGAFAVRGVTKQATVHGVKATMSTAPSGRRRTLRYRAVVTFRSADGTLQRATTRWPTEVRPAVGRDITVRYDPERPRRVVPADGAGSHAPSTAAVVAVGVVSIGIGWLISSVLRAVS